MVNLGGCIVPELPYISRILGFLVSWHADSTIAWLLRLSSSGQLSLRPRLDHHRIPSQIAIYSKTWVVLWIAKGQNATNSEPSTWACIFGGQGCQFLCLFVCHDLNQQIRVRKACQLVTAEVGVLGSLPHMLQHCRGIDREGAEDFIGAKQQLWGPTFFCNSKFWNTGCFP